MSRRRLTLDSPTGAVTITEADGAIVGVTWGGATVTSGGNEDGGLLQDAAQQLRAYFAGARHAFYLPLKPRGREFHRTRQDNGSAGHGCVSTFCSRWPTDH